MLEEIKSLITMDDILDKYGFEKNRAGYITCPFHSEKTASLKINRSGKSFKCYGCRASGTVIDFVMMLFNINIGQALLRINEDFNLNLSSKRADSRKIIELREQQRKKRAELEAYRKQYDDNIMEFKRLWKAKQEKAPKSAEENFDPAFCEALNKLPVLEYWFEHHNWR